MKYISNYLHPDISTQETFELVRNTLATPLQQFLPNLMLTQEALAALPEHGWLKDLECILVHPDSHSLDSFMNELISKAEITPDYINKNGLPLIALDLETNGLGKNISTYGGVYNPVTVKVGICVAVSETTGYYLPVLHNGTDGIKNWSLDILIPFLNEMQERFNCIYHHAYYDREILETNGVTLNPDYMDTNLMAINMGLKLEFFTTGLKELSHKLLERKMLELKDIVASKQDFDLRQFPATSLTVYGASDAMNTFALFKKFTNPKNDKNPYLVNPVAMLLDTKTSDASRYMVRMGFPLDYEQVSKTLRTLVRRSIILENLFKEKISNEIPIGSSEKVGILIGDKLQELYRAHMKTKNPDLEEARIWTKFKEDMQKHFYMEVKEKTLKGSTNVKVTYGSGAEIIQALMKIDKHSAWIPEDVREKFKVLANILDEYRTVQHDIGIFIKMYRFGYTDDLNFHRFNFDLKLNGTDTFRWANQGGKGSLRRITFTRQVRGTKTSLVREDAVAGPSVQGIPSQKPKVSTFLKLKNIPEELQRELDLLSNQVEVKIRAMLEEI